MIRVLRTIKLFVVCVLFVTAGFSRNVALAESVSSDAVTGKWWILGNTTRGILDLTIDKEDRVTGSIYNQPIRGSWDGAKGELTFIRYIDEQATQPLQQWNGKAVEVDCNYRKVLVLEGSFHTLNEGEDAAKREYPWSGQLATNPAPSLDIKQLQGDWIITHVTRCLNPNVKLPDEIGLNVHDTLFTIQGNQIKAGGNVTASIANDLQSAVLANEVGFLGSRVMVITTPNGQGMICSYYIENDVVEIAYPHTTSCHRGSGHILRLQRKTTESPIK
ncbi:MAG: hypothetical protein U0892_04360 [Pirellulales bacterium]